MDAARALVLGASASGVARTVLPASLKGQEETMGALNALIEELKAAMFLTGVGNIPDLQVQEFILSDQLLSWLARFEQEE